MTRARRLKKAIRARAVKTGESYTTARRQLLTSRVKPAAGVSAVRQPSPATTASKKPAPAARGALGALSDAACLKRTGHGLDHWFEVLDRVRARSKGHTDLARHLYDDHGVPGWHSQGIAVAYERARGLRVANQLCDGTYQVSVSRVVPVPMMEAVDAIGSRRRRARWLEGADAGLAGALNAALDGPSAKRVTVKDDNNARFRFKWDGATVEIRLTGKPGGKVSVVADSKNLSSPSVVETRRAEWRVALDSLSEHLTR